MMMEKIKNLKEKASNLLREKPMSKEQETLITLFLSSIQSWNIQVLFIAQNYNQDWVSYQYFHHQLYKDSELLNLLFRFTNYSSNPMVYLYFSDIQRELLSKTNLLFYLSPWSIYQKETFYRYLALSHSFKSDIRFLPLFPADKELNTPFLSILHNIETENAKQIQIQIALLRNMPLSENIEKERKRQIVEEERQKVMTVWGLFLEKFILL